MLDRLLDTPDIAIIGHLTEDLTPDGSRPGGVVTYAAAVAARLGLRVAILTRTALDPALAIPWPGVDVLRLDSATTTVMEQHVEAGRRVQHLRSAAGSIGAADVPDRLKRTPLVLLGPVIGEVEASVAACFPGALIGATAQGWLRSPTAGGLLLEGRLAGLDVQTLAAQVTVLCLSDEDLAGSSVPNAWLRAFPIVVLTRGRDGLDCYHGGHCRHLPAFPAVERDPTGAGDAFAAAFLIRYAETRDVAEAARFGAAVASLLVEAPGVESAPDRAAVEARLRQHPEVHLVPCGGV